MVYLLLIAAAFAAGAINSVAGGGSFLTFPSLVFAGVSAVSSNASSTVALLTGTISTVVSYRDELKRFNDKRFKLWFAECLLGGALGAYLLLVTSDKTFRQIAPWLLLFATLLFAFGGTIGIALRGKMHSSQVLMVLMLFPISIYGGYFGGGIGIMLLAAFRLYGFTDIHLMNAMKAILGGSLNAVAAVIFIAAHQVSWKVTLIMMVAAIGGGYAGPAMARRMSQSVIRGIVITVGLSMSAYFFYISPR
jgi:uncharacterized membrane protein YfcA